MVCLWVGCINLRGSYLVTVDFVCGFGLFLLFVALVY